MGELIDESHPTEATMGARLHSLDAHYIENRQEIADMLAVASAYAVGVWDDALIGENALNPFAGLYSSLKDVRAMCL